MRGEGNKLSWDRLTNGLEAVVSKKNSTMKWPTQRSEGKPNPVTCIDYNNPHH